MAQIMELIAMLMDLFELIMGLLSVFGFGS
jgi:hypothetical protein